MKFYTADWHLNSRGSLQWFSRPYKTVEKMNQGLIRSANMKAKIKSDVIFHIGDFLCWGNEKGIPSLKIPAKEHINQINATLILLEGNHDDNNKVKAAIKWLTTDLGDSYHNISIGHYPSHCPEAQYQFRKNSIRLCGHVHRAWKYYYDEENNVLNINMGCDVWNYQLVSEPQIINYIRQIESKIGKKWR